MAHHHLEQEAQAKEWLSKANERSQEELGTDQGEREVAWNRRLTLKLLREEAEALLGLGSKDDPQKP